MLKHRRLESLLVAALLAVLSTPVLAQDGSNVLVVVNTASAAAEEIAARYTRARSIPADNVLRITTAVTEDIDRARFDREIHSPIATWITRYAAQDRILYVV